MLPKTAKHQFFSRNTHMLTYKISKKYDNNNLLSTDKSNDLLLNIKQACKQWLSEMQKKCSNKR